MQMRGCGQRNGWGVHRCLCDVVGRCWAGPQELRKLLVPSSDISERTHAMSHRPHIESWNVWLSCVVFDKVSPTAIKKAKDVQDPTSQLDVANPCMSLSSCKPYTLHLSADPQSTPPVHWPSNRSQGVSNLLLRH